MLRLINVVSGEVELAVMVEKTILSIGAGGDKFKYLDLDTQLLEIEAGIAMNEPVTYAVRKTIEGSVVELIKAGEKKGLWKYKPKPEPEPEPIEDELLEELIEVDDELRTEVKEEVYDDYKKKPEVKVEKQEIPEEVFTQKLLDELECGINPHKLMCLEKFNEASNTSSDTPHTDDR